MEAASRSIDTFYEEGNITIAKVELNSMYREDMMSYRTRMLIALAAICAVAQSTPSLAQYRHQKNAICHDMLKSKGVKKENWRAETEKCRTDPANYK